MDLKTKLENRRSWASIFWLTAAGIPVTVSIYMSPNKLYVLGMEALFFLVVFAMIATLRLRQGMVTFGEDGKRGFIYVGRDFMRQMTCCVQIGWGFRHDAGVGELQWRRYYFVSWNWLPTIRWQLNYRGRRRPVGIQEWRYHFTRG